MPRKVNFKCIDFMILPWLLGSSSFASCASCARTHFNNARCVSTASFSTAGSSCQDFCACILRWWHILTATHYNVCAVTVPLESLDFNVQCRLVQPSSASHPLTQTPVVSSLRSAVSPPCSSPPTARQWWPGRIIINVRAITGVTGRIGLIEQSRYAVYHCQKQTGIERIQ